jgi:hypothetical protein
MQTNPVIRKNTGEPHFLILLICELPLLFWQSAENYGQKQACAAAYGFRQCIKKSWPHELFKKQIKSMVLDF